MAGKSPWSKMGEYFQAMGPAADSRIAARDAALPRQGEALGAPMLPAEREALAQAKFQEYIGQQEALAAQEAMAPQAAPLPGYRRYSR